LQNFLIL